MNIYTIFSKEIGYFW